MSPEVTIRAARTRERSELEDVQRRASLAWDEYREAILAHPDAIALPVEQIAQQRVRVAEHAGRIVGFMVVLPREDGGAEIDGLFVEPGSWRRGIGTRLIREAERMAYDAGLASLHVVTSPQARGFYAACGFDPVGDAQTRFGHALSMRKHLAASHSSSDRSPC
jgi:GNAT superfamily N-acetyltransferase